MDVAGRVIARKRDDAKALWVLGGLYEIKVSGAESGGAVTLVEMTIPAGMGPPPHLHAEAETVYVLDGTLRLHIGNDVLEGGPGSVFHIPKGKLENFEPAGESVRILAVYTPGGIDKFFEEIGEIAPSRIVPPPMTSPPDFERLAATALRYGLELRKPKG